MFVQVEELTTELDTALERLSCTQDLLEQAQGDTQAWTVRVQILSLELGGELGYTSVLCFGLER